MSDLLYKDESYKIVGICMDVHRQLGGGFLEIVYKDALEYEFKQAKIPFDREKEYSVSYKGILLPHKFYADFVVYDKIILEVKAQLELYNNSIPQVINYLAVSRNKLGILVNFGKSSLEYKRIVY